MTDWHEIAKVFSTNGLTAPQITRELIKLGAFTDISYNKAYDRVRKFLKRNNKAVANHEVEKKQIVQNYEPSVHSTSWDGTRTIKFGLIGDTQINSKYTQLTYLHDFYDRCVEEDVHVVYHTGDIDDGDQMRVGHQYELYNVGADSHVDEIVRVYPRREGIVTKFITGNHDASIYKHSGHDIGASIASKREDMEYLGRDCAVVYLTPNCTLELRHPWDGTSYALSYKMQKIIDAYDSSNKPTILAVGHYHKMEQLFYKDVFAFQTACFQSATPFTVGKGISVSMGGWIIEVTVDERGTVKCLNSKFIPYTKAIKDDYKSFA